MDGWLRVGEGMTANRWSKGICFRGDGIVLYLDYSYTTVHLSKLIQLHIKKSKYNCR